jgi:parvulin-like peptidyl-prolyl isomerase
MFSKRTQILLIVAVMPLLLVVAGCGGGQPAASTVSPTAQATSTMTAAPVATTAVPTPTVTPEPLAVRVNGEGISEAVYQADLRQLQEALQTTDKTLSPEEQRQRVLDNLTETLLLAQGAVENGFQVDDAALQAEIERLGGVQAVQEWMSQRGYSETAFQQALKLEMAAAWQRDQIIAAVPTEAEQVHARQILTIDENIAYRALELVKIPGTNFSAYALQYDPTAGGDLGWFPRGYLTQTAVEEAAFSLQPGEISGVVKSEIGFHIVQVIAREPVRTISPDARRVLQHKALQAWLEARRAASSIEILLP